MQTPAAEPEVSGGGVRACVGPVTVQRGPTEDVDQPGSLNGRSSGFLLAHQTSFINLIIQDSPFTCKDTHRVDR